ncbi:hypothetical protein FRB93_002083 [Tulasnella sp. JGI-2019a]|nr:hypothetical protein FRB93_002083 [Tulasnella sp. JGI-2019a]
MSGNTDMKSALSELVGARRALKGAHTELLVNAVDQLTEMFKNIKSDEPSLAQAIARLNHTILVPISMASSECEIRFEPQMQEQVNGLARQLSRISEESRLSKSWSLRVGVKDEIEKISRKMSGALDELKNMESMNATLIWDAIKPTVLIRKNPGAPLLRFKSFTGEASELGSECSEPEAGSFMANCSPLRILVLGKAGTGKSTLVNEIFQVNDAHASDFVNGEPTDIDTEIKSASNPQFILHDSQGFVLGERENMNTLKDFIQRRNMKPQIKDKLHAIWLCIETPFAGSRAFEAGDQEFLGVHFGVPVIVVYTKYDLLEQAMEVELEDDPAFDDWDESELDSRIQEAAKQAYHSRCVDALMRLPGGKGGLIPHMRVSKKGPESLKALAQLTAELCNERLGESAWLSFAMAQRIDLKLKLEATVKVAKKNHWKGIASSFQPLGSFKACLDDIHVDLLKVWNLPDGMALLHSEEFKHRVRLLISDLKHVDPSPRQNLPAIGSVCRAASHAAAAIPTFGQAASPIIDLAAMAAVGFYAALKETPSTKRALMGYIIGLTALLTGLFRDIQSSPRVVDREVTLKAILSVVDTYDRSRDKAQCHREIKESPAPAACFLKIGNRAKLLQEIIRLMETYVFHSGSQIRGHA